MSFFAELRQRRVIRVAAVYLVTAWVAIQAASIALPAFDAPDWTLRVVILLFALGFPLAIVLTWAVDVTPEGLRLASGKVGNKRVATICAALVVLALGWYFYGQPALRSGTRAPERSIAVLPFVNMSGNPANEYFSDGLSETTLDMLAQVPDLKVIARTSSFAFKGKATDLREVGRRLGAAHLLEGSVQQAGDTVRITVQLIRAADGSHLWSRRFDRRATDVFRIQDEIATAVVSALQLQLPESAQRRLLQKRTEDVGAYHAYLKGIALLPRRKVGEMRQALGHFERAIQLDPTYARAYVGAHDAIHLLETYGSVTAAERRRSLEYLDRALALAPELGEAHVARGAELEKAGDVSGAEAAYRRGLALAPGYATGQQWLGELLGGAMGRFDEAMPYLEKARALDPLSPVIAGVHAFVLGQAGRVEEALAIDDALVARHPDIARTYDERSLLHQMRGDLVAALRDLRMQERLDPDAVGFRSHRCHALMDFGALPEAGHCLAALERLAPEASHLRIARARLEFLEGRPDAALALLESVQPAAAGMRDLLLVQLGRGQEALVDYRRRLPRLFAAGAPQVYPGEAWEALHAGIALLRTGEEARGRAVLEAAIGAVADRPYAALVAGRGWLEVPARAAMGDAGDGFAALQRGVEAGYFQGLAELDAAPLLAGLRADPRYARVLAPARARAQAQIEAARRAGLL